ncbi:hypothetical protein RchiOBHm_Chr2g0146021 [Rosa chinensis]|uniref:Uncharacterized protein n=1 Tax=Rosa chinensis TaxID=74649 RepID=A0A2P6RYT6_ROSCH|nr:hypothetical protein RchiOBHm_Chr2g0146021 [Rosa chinensis]
MQKSLRVIFLLLFVCLLFSAISIYYFDSDSANSVQLKFSSGLNSVMSTKTTKRKLRRISQDNNEDGQDNQTETQRMFNDESFATVSNMDAHCQRKSRSMSTDDDGREPNSAQQ